MNAAAETVQPIAWSDAFLLGHAAMDDTHHEFVACVSALQQASDREAWVRLEAVAEHAAQHFAQEERWMRDSAFPSADCHAAEHAAVLSSVHEVQGLLGEGANRQLARDLAQALAQWFPAHADYMDAALSHWLSQQRHGGTPLVLRRGVPTAHPAFETGHPPP